VEVGDGVTNFFSSVSPAWPFWWLYPFDHPTIYRVDMPYTTNWCITILLATEDGAVAIFGPGEALHLTFAASLAAPKAGWTRRFVLEARGWCKDMDLYTKDGDTVEPLPGTRGPAATRLQQRYTTRYESGR